MKKGEEFHAFCTWMELDEVSAPKADIPGKHPPSKLGRVPVSEVILADTQRRVDAASIFMTLAQWEEAPDSRYCAEIIRYLCGHPLKLYRKTSDVKMHLLLLRLPGKGTDRPVHRIMSIMLFELVDALKITIDKPLPFPELVRIGALVVHNKLRRGGIGTLSLRCCEAVFKGMNAKMAMVETTPDSLLFWTYNLYAVRVVSEEDLGLAKGTLSPDPDSQRPRLSKHLMLKKFPVDTKSLTADIVRSAIAGMHDSDSDDTAVDGVDVPPMEKVE